MVVYQLKVNKVKLIFEKSEEMLVAEKIFTYNVLPILNGIQQTLAGSVKSCGAQLDPALLLHKQVNPAAKNNQLSS